MAKATGTKVVTGKVRFSYLNAFAPRAVSEGQEPKYSVCLLIPKSDMVRPLQVAQFSSAANQVALQLQTDIKQDSGQNQFTRGETAGGVTAASAIAALQEAGGKITRDRTAKLNRGFERMVEQVMWLVAQFYGADRVRLVTGKDGRQREVNMSSAHLFGIPPEGGTLPPPPYSVQVQVQRRNPMRVQAQNEIFMQAFGMSAQAGVQFPLSLLFELLNVDGKDEILPALQGIESYTQQMQQMQQALEQAQAQVAQQEEALGNMQQVMSQQEQAMGQGMYQDEAVAEAALPAAGLPPGVVG